MRRLLTLGFLATVSLASALFAKTPPETPRFAHEHSDLKADPAARFGKLPNGLHYVVLANHEPKERASLRLVVLAGSFHETDDQQGLAHFLEHMAFNGSIHYPPGTIVEYFQRMGMSFGGDTNAYTSFDHTAYMLELPDTKTETLAEGIKVFSDYASGLLLLEPELNKERGIILSEKRARDSVEFRQLVAELKFVIGDTLLPKRMPIGIESVIEKAARDRFVDFYDTWYRPSRMAIVAVGDFDPAAIGKQITDNFSSFTARGPARPSPEIGNTYAFNGVRTLYHHEPEAGATTVAIQTASPIPPEADTAATRIARLPRDLAVAILNRRLDILVKEEGAPFTRGQAAVNDAFDLFRNALIELTCKPAQWSDALAVADQELRRALEHGFQPAELAEARANFLNGLEQAALTASTRRSDQLASELISALTQDEVFTTPADDLALLKPALEKITVEQCAAALRAAFSAPGRFVSVMGNAKIEPAATAASSTSPDAQILAAYESSRAKPVTAPTTIADAAFAYTDFGPAGKVTSRQHVDDLDVDLVTFANDVRLNLKKTAFEAGKIRVSVRIGAGRLTEPKTQPGLAYFTDKVFTAGGLGKHSVDDLERILAGKTVGLDFRIAGDAFQFTTLTNRDDLLLQLQLLAAYLTDAGWRPESIRVAHKNFEQLYTRLAHIPDGPLQLEVPRLLASGDPRFGLPSKEQLLARTLDEARAWATPQLTTGPIEIAIVGDLDPDATLAAVAQTFGALPARQPKPAYEAERQAAFPEPFAKDFTVTSEIPKGYVALYWPTTDSRDIRTVRRLSVLSEVFSDRLRVKIREELGDAYSPQTSSGPSDTYRNYGLMTALIAVDPAKAKIVTDATLEIATDLATNGVNEDELERAKKPILTSLREAGRNNQYWLFSVLGSAQEQPQRLDWRRSIDTDFAAITKTEIDALAKQYLPAARAFRVTSLPVKP
ncbi:peptidase M16 [Nibricoccus aquaticus]|uniref:Peptidase M16 n=1 Tax=Nibricoccus aquaticus TaxID=2576891 RepID=A0A290QJY2_9BACT|nr:insulinase family protein [Nibricoccus aquaticus]ATC64641.1 peptidase M16 [Nibricoccus aquaticus]